MPIISQNLTIPPTLANGQIADAQHVIALYNTFNAQLIPDTIGVFQQALVEDTLTTLSIGGIVTKDWSIPAVPRTKALLVLLPFSWSTSGGTLAPSLTFRVNGGAVTTATVLTSAASGGGLVRWWIGPHDTDVPRPSSLQIFDGTAVFHTQLNTDLPNADTTSVGVTFGNASSGTLRLKYVRFWREG